MKWIRHMFWASLLFLAVAVVLTATLRWFAVSREAEADVAMMMAPPPAPTGDNGFAALALINHEVPADQLAQALAEDVARFASFERINREAMVAMARKSPQSATDGGLAYTLLEDSGYPRREPIELGDTACRWRPEGCLAQVRDNADAVRALLAQAGERTALAERALASGHIHSPFPPALSAPLPAYQMLRLPLTAAALDAVEGRVPDAMARTCGVLANARRHGRNSPDLIHAAVMSSLANGAAGLLLDLRRAAPETPLPPACRAALEPVRGEDYLICSAMRGEFRMVSRVGHELDASLAERWNPRDVFLRLTAFDAGTQDAWMAPRFADTCRDNYRDQVLAGQVPPSTHRVKGLSSPTCWGAVISCILSDISMPSADKYQQRQLDNAARLRVQLAALAVLDGRITRDQATTAGASPGYPVEVEGDRLVIPLQYTGQDPEPRFSVAL